MPRGAEHFQVGVMKKKEVTIISLEDIEMSNGLLTNPYTAAETRRNIVISGKVELLKLIDREFAIGPVRLRGLEDCEPCTHPERLSGKPGFQSAFQKRAGIRAQVLSNGTISIGDTLITTR